MRVFTLLVTSPCGLPVIGVSRWAVCCSGLLQNTCSSSNPSARHRKHILRRFSGLAGTGDVFRLLQPRLPDKQLAADRQAADRGEETSKRKKKKNQNCKSRASLRFARCEGALGRTGGVIEKGAHSVLGTRVLCGLSAQSEMGQSAHALVEGCPLAAPLGTRATTLWRRRQVDRRGG